VALVATQAVLRGQRPQYLTFGVAGDEYAVSILRVREILRYPSDHRG
jgi:chemotaxis signal transduction protein